MEILIPALILVGLPLVWLIGNYNGIVRVRNHCREAWSDIDTELKRRHDLIPNLVETVKAYARHEQAVLEAVVDARARAEAIHGSPKAQAAEENRLVSTLGGLFAVAERYPDLKANRHFLDLQRELVHTEDRIQAARRFYNANVRELNNRVEMFPSSLVASLMAQKTADYFEIDALAERAAPVVDATADQREEA